ncbi:MAG: type 4a pilus biogenesis protein PilO [Nitrospiria bacterium]
MEINAETLKHLTNTQKFVTLALVVVILVGGFVWFVFIPKNNEIARLEEEISGLNNAINIHRIKVRKLVLLQKENADLQVRLAELKEQLPPEAEVEVLLRQISELGGRTGLEFKLWRPGTKVRDPSGLYVRIPVSVEVAGGYHSLALFFDRISQLSRIVNVSNIRMTSPKEDKGKIVIQTSFSATAFASGEGG